MPTSLLMMLPRMIQVCARSVSSISCQKNGYQAIPYLLIALVLVACGDNKVSQCNQLIAKINETEEVLSYITQSSPPAINAVEDIATATEQALTELETVELNNRNLRSFKSRFSEFYSDISTNARAIVQAHGSQNMQEAEVAYDKLEATFQTQDTLVTEINNFCREGYDE